MQNHDFAKQCMIQKRICPICGGGEYELLFSLHYTFPKEYRDCRQKNVVFCGSCGFIYNIDEDEGKELDAYVAENNRYEGVPFGFYGSAYDYILENHDPSANILDVGCGQGFLLRKLKDAGYANLYGLDPSAFCIEQLRAYGIKGEKANLYDIIPEFNGVFDVIVFTNVIEHIEHPKEGLENISTWLKDEGIIYATCPNVNNYKNSHYYLSGLYCAEHINHFTPGHLNNLFVNCGFSCLYSDTESLMTGIYKKTASLDIKEYSVNTAEAKALCLRAYEMIVEQKNIVKEYFDKNAKKKVAIWGMSHTFMQMYPEAFKNCEIDCVVDIDKSKHGIKIDNIEVRSPDYLFSFDGAIVVLNTSSKQSILEYIKSSGLGNEIIVF